ncbi:hypothetical protein ACHAW5_003082 [Stephanodiscus triporus]|uniref:Carbohydrate kinase PfkB domain-containing protein n=1 Tax=Stephanodiscus triporus TaxID=2934178 RepID=A0ABD3MFU9_9STRA
MGTVTFASSLFLFALTIVASSSSSSSRTPPATAAAMALSQSVVVIGLNAALQKRFVLPPNANLVPGNVHRAHRCTTGVGGKGQDVAVAMSCLLVPPSSREEGRGRGGVENEDVSGGGGYDIGAEGDAVSDALKSRHGLTNDSLTIRTDAPLRTCTTIVGADAATELVETSGTVTAEEMKALRDGIDALTTRGGGVGRRNADCVCVMGSMPPGCPDDTYADLTSRLADGSTLVLVDSVIGLDPLLGALKSIFDDDDDDDDDSSRKGKKGGAVLKLNAAELCKLAGVHKKSETCRVTPEELSASTRGFLARHPNAIGALEYLCVTDGKFPGYVVDVKSESAPSGSFRAWQLPPVDLSTKGTLYPIGAGDTVSGGTLAAMQYLRRGGGGGGGKVIRTEIGKRLSEKRAEWRSGGAVGASSEDDEGYDMATAFAFGLACGSASCLREDNSVFDVDDAMSFFVNSAEPVSLAL